MIRTIAAALTGVILMLSGVSLTASAQTEAERVNAFGSWSLELTDTVNQAIGMMERSVAADEIALAYSNGEISQREAETQLDAWKASADAEFADLSTRVQQLVDAPRQFPAGFDELADAMAEAPTSALTALEGYLNQSERYNRAVLAGENPDINASVIARFGVLQVYYESLMVSNRVARDSVQATHPQFFLLDAMITNMRNSQLLMEAASQALGAAPSQYAARNIPSAIEANARAVRMAVRNGRSAQQTWLQTLETNTPAQIGLTEQQRRVLVQMMQTYTPSFENELNGAAIHANNIGLVDVAPEGGLVYNVFDDALVAYEAARDQYQIERQRLATNF